MFQYFSKDKKQGSEVWDSLDAYSFANPGMGLVKTLGGFQGREYYTLVFNYKHVGYLVKVS